MTYTIRGRMRELEAEIRKWIPEYNAGDSIDFDDFDLEIDTQMLIWKWASQLEALKEAAEAVEARITELNKWNCEHVGCSICSAHQNRIDELKQILGAEGE